MVVHQLRLGLVGGVRLLEGSLSAHDQLQFLRDRRPLHAAHPQPGGEGRLRHQLVPGAEEAGRETGAGTDHDPGGGAALFVAVREDIQHDEDTGDGDGQDRALARFEPHRRLPQGEVLQGHHLQGQDTQAVRDPNVSLKIVR